MDDILDNIDFDIENNRTVFLKESDPFLPVIPSPKIQEEHLEERLRTPPATPIHSPHCISQGGQMVVFTTTSVDIRTCKIG